MVGARRSLTRFLLALSLPASGLAAGRCAAGSARADGTCPSRPSVTDPVLLQTKAKAALKAAGQSEGALITDAEEGGDCGGTITWRGTRCLDVPGGSPNNGNLMQMWDCQPGNTNQRFVLPSGYGQIRWAANPAKCLDTKGGKVQLWDCNSDKSQQFAVPKGSSGVFASQDKCMDVTMGSTANGARVQIWQCSSELSPNPNQVFTNPCPTQSVPQPQPQPQPQPGTQRKGSFLVIGDWGFDMLNKWHGGGLASDSCQRLIADRMAQEMNRLGDVKFVINVGDSFYPGGVTSKSDRRWNDVWRNVYSSKLRALPWYSIYGNHDLHQDPGVCSWDDRQGAQINADFNNRNFFYMPSTSYFAELPELNSEIIAVDQNYEWQGELCKWVPNECKSNCPNILKGRNDRGFQLFHDRVANSQAKNLIVITHYPTDFCHQHQGCERFKDVLRTNAKGKLAYFTGHTHVVQPMQVRDPSVFQNPGNFWLSGGGGGWSTEGDQGFVVGQIGADGNLTTYPVLIDSRACLP